MGEVEQLVRRSKKRNPDAFTELMQLHERDMYRTASAILSQDADIADAMQETILTCWEKIDTLQKNRYFKTWMIIPLGIAAFVVFYAVFYFAITKFDLKTPGREDEDDEAEKKVVLANNNYTEVASAVLAAVGGKENVKDVGYCATRLRFEVKDSAKVDEKAVKAAGAAGVIRPSKTACQVIIGTKVQFVYDELKKML